MTNPSILSPLLLLLLPLPFLTHAFLAPFPKTHTHKPTPLLGHIKGVETFEGTFTLSPESEATLLSHLDGQELCSEVQTNARATTAKFTGQLFQPVPYSPGTPHGMPRDFEDFHLNPDYCVINVPPVVMFKAKIFSPPRLCAVYKVEGRHPEEVEKILQKAQAKRDLSQQVAIKAAAEEDGTYTQTHTQTEERRSVFDSPPPPPSQEHEKEGEGNGVEKVTIHRKKETWATVGRAIREVVVEGTADESEDDEAELDAMVV